MAASRSLRRWFSSAAAIPYPSCIHVDLGAVSNNVQQLKALARKSGTTLAVAVKGDAYGHGAAAVAKAALAAGADQLAVASIAEAAGVRSAGIPLSVELLSMGYIPPEAAPAAAQLNVTATVVDIENAAAFAAELADKAPGKRLKVHIKVDSGMGRFGVMPQDARALADFVTSNKCFELDGMYTHFSVADDDALEPFTRKQLATFQEAAASLKSRPRQLHCANSAAFLRSSDFHLDMVRIGIAMYGCQPGDGKSALPAGFRQALSWKTRIAQVKTLPAGHTIGYGNTFTVPRAMRVGLLPVGYADCFRRGPKNAGFVLVGGRKCAILGRVSMEKTMVDLDAVPTARVGDEAVLIGQQGDARITVEDYAAAIASNNYETLTSALPRIPRQQHGQYWGWCST